jgi:hypothetical protein
MPRSEKVGNSASSSLPRHHGGVGQRARRVLRMTTWALCLLFSRAGHLGHGNCGLRPCSALRRLKTGGRRLLATYVGDADADGQCGFCSLPIFGDCTLEISTDQTTIKDQWSALFVLFVFPSQALNSLSSAFNSKLILRLIFYNHHNTLEEVQLYQLQNIQHSCLLYAFNCPLNCPLTVIL